MGCPAARFGDLAASFTVKNAANNATRPPSLTVRDLRLLQLRKLGRHRRVATGQLLDGEVFGLVVGQAQISDGE